MSPQEPNSPWICHVCDTKGQGESQTCSNCYKVACLQHIQHVTSYNPQTGLYQLMPVCLDCAIREAIQ